MALNSIEYELQHTARVAPSPKLRYHVVVSTLILRVLKECSKQVKIERRQNYGNEVAAYG